MTFRLDLTLFSKGDWDAERQTAIHEVKVTRKLYLKLLTFLLAFSIKQLSMRSSLSINFSFQNFYV